MRNRAIAAQDWMERVPISDAVNPKVGSPPPWVQVVRRA